MPELVVIGNPAGLAVPARFADPRGTSIEDAPQHQTATGDLGAVGARTVAISSTKMWHSRWSFLMSRPLRTLLSASSLSTTTERNSYPPFRCRLPSPVDHGQECSAPPCRAQVCQEARSFIICPFTYRDSRSFLQRAIQRRAIDLIKPSNEAPFPSSIIATASRICDGVNETGLPSFSPRTGFSKGDGAQSLMVRMDLRQILVVLGADRFGRKHLVALRESISESKCGWCDLFANLCSAWTTRSALARRRRRFGVVGSRRESMAAR